MRLAAFHRHIADRRADAARVRWLGELLVYAVVLVVLVAALIA